MGYKSVGYTCFVEHKCPICGGDFFPTLDWVYNDGEGKRVCSWPCHCEARRRKETRKKTRKETPTDPDRNKKILELAKEGVPVPEIASKFRISKERILQIIRANRE